MVRTCVGSKWLTRIPPETKSATLYGGTRARSAARREGPSVRARRRGESRGGFSLLMGLDTGEAPQASRGGGAL
eukprot:2306318-Prymnesium_polylepis.1